MLVLCSMQPRLGRVQASQCLGPSHHFGALGWEPALRLRQGLGEGHGLQQQQVKALSTVSHVCPIIRSFAVTS